MLLNVNYIGCVFGVFSGDITKIKVEHDNAGISPGWLLDRVEITNTASDRKWTFVCNAWLDKRKGDGEIAKEFYPRE